MLTQALSAPMAAVKLICCASSLQNMTMDKFGAKNANLKGIQYLRNVEDADALVAYMKEAKKVSKKAVMVGGGYIGLEVTANLVQNGFEGLLNLLHWQCSPVMLVNFAS